MRKSLLVLILLALSILITPVLTSCGGYSSTNHNPKPKAAIIDQLHCIKPNPTFIEKTRKILEDYGFSVDVWQGEEVTVSLYQELAKHGYRLIILRAHLGILCLVGKSKVIPANTTCLFTSEAYTTTKYVIEQLTDALQEGQMTEDRPTVFAISPKFVANNIKGKFDNTVILMMGCASHYLDDMANAFIQKGASVYLGWSATVTLDYVDEATLTLLDNLCTKEMTIAQATSETMFESGRDPYYRAYLTYSPAKIGNQTIRKLVR